MGVGGHDRCASYPIKLSELQACSLNVNLLSGLEKASVPSTVIVEYLVFRQLNPWLTRDSTWFKFRALDIQVTSS